MKRWTKVRLSIPTSPRLSVFLVALMVGYGAAEPLLAEQVCPEKTIGPLLEVLRDKDLQQTDPNRVWRAIHEVGQLRCPEAIDDLIALLTFRSSYGQGESRVILMGVYTGNRYPATNALAEIGKAALPALIKAIEMNDEGALISKNARYTARAIIHDERPVVDKFFKDAATKAPTAEAKRRLLKALETADADFKSD